MIKKYKIKIKHPRFNDEFFGFKKIEQYFLDILKKKKLSNAYIFNGIKGIGKATFVYRLARCILNKDNSLNTIDSLHISKKSNIFKNIMNLSHPDINIIEPDEENKKINLEKIKLLDKITFKTSLESDYKIIIIDSLDDFTTKKSFSSLLKLLEDCPINCIFFLISHSLYKVPHTIKSRCQKIYFNPIPDKTLRKWFEQSEIINEKNLDILINLSNGSLGWALDIINNNESKSNESIESILGELTQLLNSTDKDENKIFSNLEFESRLVAFYNRIVGYRDTERGISMLHTVITLAIKKMEALKSREEQLVKISTLNRSVNKQNNGTIHILKKLNQVY